MLEAERSVRRLKEWHGDIRLGDLTREKAREFKDALARVPTRLPADLRRLPMRDLLKQELKGYPTQHAAPINKTLNILSAIVSHAEAARSLDTVPAFKNPFGGKGIKLVVDARAADERQPFSAADLKATFSTGVYRSGERPRGARGEAAFWLSLTALLSGARQGELAPLRVMDVA
ncbi:lambda integrase-like/DNA breaking-rejoining enzyme [Methylorubrum populi]|uniref:Lambda integrase-like/DNA breaking-rejoining enzyme n=1 Tax=Methylorubrum populi TaxID=223967 RepID=A0A160PIW5_9HYPH|nr:lambda integrase-like/DNA breaking-rejoining enzyme [Methylorubrum populi]